jgi:hypothetical protein
MDPGATAVYPQWAAPTTIKMIDATFLREKNISRACFHMFDTNIAAQFKVSSIPTLTGLNLTMSVNEILQLQDSYVMI